MTLAPEVEVQDGVAALEARLTAVEALPESPERQLALEAVIGLMELYGRGLARIVELAPEALTRFADDELVAHLLLLHDLHPVPVGDRVEAALVSVRPYLATHGGNVELVSVSSGVARVRLDGACHGCSASTATLKQAIEKAIYEHAPDVSSVEAEGVVEPVSQVISLESLVCPIP